jgi:hypothetical protein
VAALPPSLGQVDEKEAAAPPPPRDTPAGDLEPALAAQQAGGEMQGRHEAVGGEGGAAAAVGEAPLDQGQQRDGKDQKRAGRRIVAS